MRKIKDRLQQTVELSDGFITVPDAELETQYKSAYHFVTEKGEDGLKIMFPFIYIITMRNYIKSRPEDEFVEKTMLMIPRNKFVFIDTEKNIKTY